MSTYTNLELLVDITNEFVCKHIASNKVVKSDAFAEAWELNDIALKMHIDFKDTGKIDFQRLQDWLKKPPKTV
jgi:hypothetical protein